MRKNFLALIFLALIAISSASYSPKFNRRFRKHGNDEKEMKLKLTEHSSGFCSVDSDFEPDAVVYTTCYTGPTVGPETCPYGFSRYYSIDDGYYCFRNFPAGTLPPDGCSGKFDGVNVQQGETTCSDALDDFTDYYDGNQDEYCYEVQSYGGGLDQCCLTSDVEFCGNPPAKMGNAGYGNICVDPSKYDATGIGHYSCALFGSSEFTEDQCPAQSGYVKVTSDDGRFMCIYVLQKDDDVYEKCFQEKSNTDDVVFWEDPCRMYAYDFKYDEYAGNPSQFCGWFQESGDFKSCCGETNTICTDILNAGVVQSSDCGPGMISINDKCMMCPRGTYPLSGKCLPCEAGTYGQPFQDNCAECPAGTYSLAGYPNCELCPVGTWSNSHASKCTPCSEGTTSARGSSSCHACAA